MMNLLSLVDSNNMYEALRDECDNPLEKTSKKHFSRNKANNLTSFRKGVRFLVLLPRPPKRKSCYVAFTSRTENLARMD